MVFLDVVKGLYSLYALYSLVYDVVILLQKLFLLLILFHTIIIIHTPHHLINKTLYVLIMHHTKL